MHLKLIFEKRLVCQECNTPNSKPVIISIDSNIINIGVNHHHVGQCECKAGYKTLESNCPENDLVSGTCTDSFTCSSCQELNMAVSRDGRQCVSSCDGDDGVGWNDNDSERSKSRRSNVTKSVYNVETGECTCPYPNMKLVEIYNNTNGNSTESESSSSSSSSSVIIRKECHFCPYGTAVIPSSNTSTTISTAGVTYERDPYTCAVCYDENMIFDQDTLSCHCREGYILTGEASVGPQSCIKYLPSISSSDYTNVHFNFVAIQGWNNGDDDRDDDDKYGSITIDSVTMSHYYLSAASQCEYANGIQSETTIKACQTLANLCVISSYDVNSPSCQQFLLILDSRRRSSSLGNVNVVSSYHGENQWKQSMPWLYYNDNIETILRDRSIEMNVALNEKRGFTHELKFKLAKYDMDGTFMGMEDLNQQFLPCNVGATSSGGMSHSHGNSNGGIPVVVEGLFHFGSSIHLDQTCDLSLLVDINRYPMYFYDLYLVDEGATCGSSDVDIIDTIIDCLYPVPVLTTTYVENGEFPNVNVSPGVGSGSNEKYTRRFFIFDNMVRLLLFVCSFVHQLKATCT